MIIKPVVPKMVVLYYNIRFENRYLFINKYYLVVAFNLSINILDLSFEDRD